MPVQHQLANFDLYALGFANGIIMYKTTAMQERCQLTNTKWTEILVVAASIHAGSRENGEGGPSFLPLGQSATMHKLGFPHVKNANCEG